MKIKFNDYSLVFPFQDVSGELLGIVNTSDGSTGTLMPHLIILTENGHVTQHCIHDISDCETLVEEVVIKNNNRTI